MNFNFEEQKLIIERYIFIIRDRYNLKREYLVLGVPILIAILFLLFNLYTGHTFPVEKANTTVSDKTAEKLAAYEQLVASMENKSAGDTSASAQNEPKSGTLPEAAKTKDDMDQMIFIAIVIATMPYSIDVLLQKRRLKKQEVAFSDFLYKLSELMRGGIDPAKGIIALSGGELGTIKKEVRDCASSLVLGYSLEDSMNRLNNAIGSKLISRYIKIIVEAAHTGGNVADLIFRTSEDMRAVITLEREKENNLKQYAIVFYLAQGITILLVYILSTNLLPLVQGTGLKMLGGKEISDINFKQGFFHMIALNAIFGGLIIGMMTEGDLKQGLKHANILLIASYIACAAVILPTPAVPTYNITLVSGGEQITLPGITLKEPIIFNVTDDKGTPAKLLQVKVDIKPSGVLSDGMTNNQGQVTIRPIPPIQEGIYTVKVTAGRSFNSTTMTVHR